MEEGDEEYVYFLYKNNSGFFRKKDTTLALRTIDEEFPDYNLVLSKQTNKEALIEKSTFLKAIKRISIIAEERSRAINISFFKNQLEIYTSNPITGEGKEVIPADYKGEEIKLGFNAKYLIDILNAITSEKVIMKLKDKESAAIINPTDNQKYTCVLMPMDIIEYS